MRTSFSKLSLLALSLAALTACQDYEPFSEAEVAEAAAIREFTNNFEQRYGKIDPNHDWGFGPLLLGMQSNATRANVDNKNEWEEKFHMQVPGWPDTYYDWKDDEMKNAGFHYVTTGHVDEKYYSANSNPRPSLQTSGILPAGDVTDEEIQYVSWWFRTHEDPGKLPIHCTDFYIQEISSDNDRNPDGTVVTRQFIQEQVDGVWTTIQEDGHDKTTNESVWGLNKMEAKVFEGMPAATDDSELGYDHIKQFNHNGSNNLAQQSKVYCGHVGEQGTDTTKIWNNDDYTIGDTNIRLIEFFESSGTEDFAVYCTQDSKWKHNYALVHLQFRGPSGRFYDGYYLGFDYECDNINGDTRYYAPYDHYYSNWIVKLTPAVPLVEDNVFSKRIMCEDLGNTFDFDFNDVVFDVTYVIKANDSYTEGHDITATINLRASGGTLPIYVGKDPTSMSDDDLLKYEAHHLLGQKTESVPVNVGKNSKTAPIATYKLTMKSSEPGDVNVWVKNKGRFYKIETPKSGNLDKYHGGTNPEASSNDYSVAPQKFAVPVGVRWMQEMEFVEKGYQYFENWVNNSRFKDPVHNKSWYHNDNITAAGLALLYKNGDGGIGGDEPAAYTYSVNNGNGQKKNGVSSNDVTWIPEAVSKGYSAITLYFNLVDEDVSVTIRINGQEVDHATISSGSTQFTYTIPDQYMTDLRVFEMNLGAEVFLTKVTM